MIRQFVLINRDGESYDLNDLSSFLQDPDDLGTEVETEYEQVGNQYIEIEESIEQKNPSGEIVFEGYQEFYAFARFAEKKPIKMQYTTTAGTYYLDVKLKKLEKREITEEGRVCGLELESYGTYYRAVDVRNTSLREGKVYTYTYPYHYSDFLSGTVTIVSDSEQECPVRVTIFGPCVNPSWAQMVNGETYRRGKVNVELDADRKLVVDTMEIPWSIREYDMNNNLIADRYEDSDFTTERFLLLKNGNNRLVFTHEGIGEMKITAEAKIFYGAV